MKERQSSTGQELPECACPTCGYAADCATCAQRERGESRPKPGDVSICLKCGEVLVFAEDMTTKAADLSSLMSLSGEQRELIERAQMHIRANRWI